MHGCHTGNESRQQFYTMMSRATIANRVYLEIVSDGAAGPDGGLPTAGPV